MTDPDLKSQLEQLGKRIPPTLDAFNVFQDRRVRHDRIRRLGTMALAFVIAVGGTWGVFAAFRDEGRGFGPARSPSPSAPAWAPLSIPTLWPELWTNTPELPDPSYAQGLADHGEPSVAWRLDPNAVAHRFVTSALGWNSVGTLVVTRLDQVPSSGGQIRYRASCGHGCLAGPAVFFLAQPVKQGPGGVWDVTAIIDTHVRIAFTGPQHRGDVPPGVPPTLAWGASMSAVVHVRDQGLIGSAGVVTSDGCATSTTTSGPLDPGHPRWGAEVQGPVNPSPGAETVPCGGTSSAFLYGYIKSGEGGSGSGDLFDPVLGIMYDLTAIPVKIAPRLAPAGVPLHG